MEKILQLRYCMCPDDEESDDELDDSIIIVRREHIMESYRPSIITSLIDKIKYDSKSSDDVDDEDDVFRL